VEAPLSYSFWTPDATNFQVSTKRVVENDRPARFPKYQDALPFFFPECHNKVCSCCSTVLSLNHIHIYKCFATCINITEIVKLHAPCGVSYCVSKVPSLSEREKRNLAQCGVEKVSPPPTLLQVLPREELRPTRNSHHVFPFLTTFFIRQTYYDESINN
jgi:hypothetical protein